MKRFPKLLVLATSLLLLVGCTRQAPLPDSAEARLPLLTQDEVARVDGRTLSLSKLMLIRDTLHDHSTERALQIGVAAIALQEEASIRGTQLPFGAGVNIARYAAGELSLEQVRPSLNVLFKLALTPPSAQNVQGQITTLLSQAKVEKNQPLLTRI